MSITVLDKIYKWSPYLFALIALTQWANELFTILIFASVLFASFEFFLILKGRQIWKHMKNITNMKDIYIFVSWICCIFYQLNIVNHTLVGYCRHTWKRLFDIIFHNSIIKSLYNFFFFVYHFICMLAAISMASTLTVCLSWLIFHCILITKIKIDKLFFPTQILNYFFYKFCKISFFSLFLFLFLNKVSLQVQF